MPKKKAGNGGVASIITLLLGKDITPKLGEGDISEVGLEENL